jgi:hypothetical protein
MACAPRYDFAAFAVTQPRLLQIDQLGFKYFSIVINRAVSQTVIPEDSVLLFVLRLEGEQEVLRRSLEKQE